MFLAILFVTFVQINLFGAAAFDEEDLPWDVQQHVQTQAIAYNEHCKRNTIVNLKDDLDLWSLLVYNKICNRSQNNQTLTWVSNQKDIVSAEVDTLRVDLADYRENIDLYDHINDYNDNAENFAMWLSTTAQSGLGIEAVRAWTLGLERRYAKLNELHTRLSTFHDITLEDVTISKDGTIAFILAEPGDALEALLTTNLVHTRYKVEKLITDTFFPGDAVADNAADIEELSNLSSPPHSSSPSHS